MHHSNDNDFSNKHTYTPSLQTISTSTKKWQPNCHAVGSGVLTWLGPARACRTPERIREVGQDYQGFFQELNVWVIHQFAL